MAPDPKAGAVLKDAEQDPLFRAILKAPRKRGFFFFCVPATWWTAHNPSPALGFGSRT